MISLPVFVAMVFAVAVVLGRLVVLVVVDILIVEVVVRVVLLNVKSRAEAFASVINCAGVPDSS